VEGFEMGKLMASGGGPTFYFASDWGIE